MHLHVMPRKPGDFSNNDDVYHKVTIGGKRRVVTKVGRPINL